MAGQPQRSWAIGADFQRSWHSWQIPVHLFSRDPVLLERFVANGLRPGMQSESAVLGGIERVGPLLLEVLDQRVENVL